MTLTYTVTIKADPKDLPEKPTDADVCIQSVVVKKGRKLLNKTSASAFYEVERELEKLRCQIANDLGYHKDEVVAWKRWPPRKVWK